MSRTVYQTLSNINVNEHVEKKNNFSYLSWAWAWGTLLKHFPESTYEIYECHEEDHTLNYFTDGRTAWVKTGVIVEGTELIEFLPVMNFRNQSIALDQITSMDVNKAIQRSLTKAVARHGLGLYLYAGEDLPESDVKTSPVASKDAINYVGEIKGLCVDSKLDFKDVCTWAKEVKDKDVNLNVNAKALVTNWVKVKDDMKKWIKGYKKQNNPSPHDLKGDFVPTEKPTK